MPTKVLLLALLTAASAAAQFEVTVQVYNNAAVPDAQLKPALLVASRVLSAAGVSLKWQPCTPDCIEVPGVNTIIVGLAGPQLEIPNKASMGFAMLAAGKGNRAVVSLPRVEDFAESVNLPIATGLGHAIAHEIGHLLIRTMSHSTGIMTAQWNKDGASRMRQGNLHFAPKDVAMIRKNLEANAPERALASKQ